MLWYYSWTILPFQHVHSHAQRAWPVTENVTANDDLWGKPSKPVHVFLVDSSPTKVPDKSPSFFVCHNELHVFVHEWPANDKILPFTPMLQRVNGIWSDTNFNNLLLYRKEVTKYENSQTNQINSRVTGRWATSILLFRHKNVFSVMFIMPACYWSSSVCQ